MTCVRKQWLDNKLGIRLYHHLSVGW